MASSTDLLYDAPSRTPLFKVVLHLTNNTTLEIHRDNYLITSNLLEETYSGQDTPFGNISSNELDITIYSERGLFSPSNTSSPYHSLIVKGIKMEVFVKPINDVNIDWDPLGVFYLYDWVSGITDNSASMTAYDKLYTIFDLPMISYNIKKNITMKTLYEDFFTSLGIDVSIPSSLTQVLKYAYIIDENKEFLTNLNKAAQAVCFCNHLGIPQVVNLYGDKILRATLTDTDQVISVSADQSIISNYDGSSVTCNTPQESEQSIVLSIKGQEIVVGNQQLSNIQLTNTPLIKHLYSSLKGILNTRITEIEATTTSINLTLVNTGAAGTADIDVYGNYVENVATVLSDDTTQLLFIDSKYIQSIDYAQTIKARLQAFVLNQLPIMSIDIRGNALLNLGDKIRIVSAVYNIDYTGIIIRNQHTYDGGYSSTITLMNEAVLEVE